MAALNKEPNFLGTVLVSLPIDPDRFLLIPTIFSEMFIFAHFGHFMNQSASARDFMLNRSSTYHPLRPGFSPLKTQEQLEIPFLILDDGAAKLPGELGHS